MNNTCDYSDFFYGGKGLTGEVLCTEAPLEDATFNGAATAYSAPLASFHGF